MLMNDLSKTRIIILLTDSSQKVTDTEMQDAYDEFIRCIATIGSSLSFDLREKLPVNKEHPTLIMRIGYAKQIPYSPRKKIETLLI